MSGWPDLNRRPLAPKASGGPTDTLDSVAFPADAAQTAHETFTPFPPAVPGRPADLMHLLTELAALPPEQRAAIAALFSPATPTVTLPTTTPVVTGRGDDEPDSLHRGYEGVTR